MQAVCGGFLAAGRRIPCRRRSLKEMGIWIPGSDEVIDAPIERCPACSIDERMAATMMEQHFLIKVMDWSEAHERRACMADVCAECASGQKISWVESAEFPSQSAWWHMKNGAKTRLCGAGRIRDRMKLEKYE